MTAACGSSAGRQTLPVPTFADPTPAAAAGSAAKHDGVLPDDCGQLLSAADLAALLAQPLDSVVIRTVRGVPEPSVGQTGRLGCTYTSMNGPAKGTTLLVLNVRRYTDAAAATRQWKLNTDAERAGEANSSDLSIGTAPAVLLQRANGAVLLVVHGGDALTFQLTGPPPGRTAQDTLVDLTQRVLPQVAASAPLATPAGPAPTTTAPAAVPAAAAAPHP
ncbi:hypothetical protein [Pseudonocardia acidicola]|uniref:DUF3558 domain-containing protein n=1 Tax=Pseudonocardia acidicola TaxID=2724939 RepID=A0ABX1S5T2_9PSEU|nr:hypothetical protein [Pseudonocardia acidicola]NMH96142.1 hypothetical protein [Pseudonocardia acidicola]